MKKYLNWNSIKILLGPLSFLLVLNLNLSPDNVLVTRMAAITIWVAVWWLLEAIELSVTAFIPFILIPLLGISDTKTVAFQYMDQVIFLFIGGFLFSFALEKWNLHKRISLKILSLIGSKPKNILLGIMLTTFFISLWISNTATTMMLLAATLSIIHSLKANIEDEKNVQKFAASLLIGLAFSASIGGMGTLVGTPTNMIFYSFYQAKFPDLNDMNFINWSKVAFPIAVVILAGCYLVIYFLLLKKVKLKNIEKSYFKSEYNKLSSWSYEEKIIGLLFLTMTILWFTRNTIDVGLFKIIGWKTFFTNTEYIQDSTVAIAIAFLLFLIPSKNKKEERLLSWEDAKKLPLGIMLLFGSGFALAKGFDESGLSNWLAVLLMHVKDAPLFILILCTCLLIGVISELASNVASIQLSIPILIAIQQNADFHPALLLVPATLAASVGFMLPVATAANTIVLGTQLINTKQMIRVGFWVDLIAIFVITILSYFLGPLIWY
ncbi:MAG: SLC13 family permease [Bacteroidota bacterium]